MGQLWPSGLPLRADRRRSACCSARCSARSTGCSSPASGCPRWRSPSARSRSTAGWRSSCSATGPSPTSRSAWTDRAISTIPGTADPAGGPAGRWCWRVVFGVVLHATPIGRALYAMGNNAEAAALRRHLGRGAPSSGCSSRPARSPRWPGSSGRCATPAPGPTTAPAWSWPWWPRCCSAACPSSAAAAALVGVLAGVAAARQPAQRAAAGRRAGRRADHRHRAPAHRSRWSRPTSSAPSAAAAHRRRAARRADHRPLTPSRRKDRPCPQHAMSLRTARRGARRRPARHRLRRHHPGRLVQRLRRRRRLGAGADPNAPIKEGLKIAFLPKQVNNPYFTDVRQRRQGRGRGVQGRVQGGRPVRGQRLVAGQLHQHAVPAADRRHRHRRPTTRTRSAAR